MGVSAVGMSSAQLAGCWELLAKDVALPLNCNPGMKSQEWPGLLCQDSHSQEGKTVI